MNEPVGGAHRDHADAARRLGDVIRRNLAELDALDPATRIDTRYAKFRALGVYDEEPT